MSLTGKVSVLEDGALDSFHSLIGQKAASKQATDPKMKLSSQDTYKELRLRGYDYGKTFQGILESNIEGMTVFIDMLFGETRLC